MIVIILITGASHTGKTLLAQRLLEKYKYPYLSIDHLKMGLIRSGNTSLTPEDDDELTGYLWPIVREIIKTAIENRQNLIIEGCYIPADWRQDFDRTYQEHIEFICLAMTEEYIEEQFDEIIGHESEIESRLIKAVCTADDLKQCNRWFIDTFGSAGENVVFIEDDFVKVMKKETSVKEKQFDMAAPDYSREECWLNFPEITKDVDTFYIYSTTYVESSHEKGAPDYASLDNPEMVMGAQCEYMTNASVFEDSANVFAPYYRQAGMRYAGEIREKTGNIDEAISGMPYDDISAALDYFFENCNCGRPFIIAGHSQGSGMVKYVLQHYFKDHPEYYERMVAAYVIGFSVTKDDLEAYPHLKFASGESDTGVIISWNTEGPKNVETNAHNVVVMPNAISINPLNWKLDETYAPAGENLGSLVPNEETGEYEIADIGADAQVVIDRGVVVTNAGFAPSEMTDYFGPDSFHEDEYNIYYNNIKDNAAKRIKAYAASKK